MPVLKNARHERFAQALAKGKTAEKAYEGAGYRPDRGAASRLSAKVNIRDRLAEIMGRAAEKVALDKSWVLDSLRQVRDLGLATELIDDRIKPAETFNLSAANRAVELVGKDLGMFKDLHEHTGKDGAAIAVEDVTPEDRGAHDLARRIAWLLAKGAKK